MNPRFDGPPQQVLVTGGTGFIGRHLVQALLADGHHLMVLSRDPAAASRLLGPKVRVIRDMQALAPTQQLDVIVNLAGARILGQRWTTRRRRVLIDSRVGLTRSLVDWIGRAQVRPRVLFSASAIGYYGVQPAGDDSELTEQSPGQPVFMSTLCRDWEAQAAQAASSGVNVVTMRFGLVLGDGGALPMMTMPIRLGLGGPLGSGRQWVSWIHLRDLIAAIAHLWTTTGVGTRFEATSAAGQVRAFNFTAPGAVTQRRFSEVAAALLHRPCWMPTPALPVRWLLGEQSDLLLQGQRVAPAALLRSGYRFEFASLPQALTDLYRR